MNSLACTVKEESDRRFIDEYTAQHLWIIADAVRHMATGKGVPTKQIVEILHPEQQDTRTAEQIIQDTLNKLG